MNRSAGNLRLFLTITFCLFLSSCILIPKEKPLNPRLLFSIGSEFLENAESLALKGSIEFEDRHHHQSGSFQLIINRGDSLSFIIEGPFKIDIFRLIIVDGMAYAIDRESDDWTIVAKNEKLMIPDYGIESINPDVLGYLIFPQFYSRSEHGLDPDRMILSSEDYDFHIKPYRDQNSFALMNEELGLTAFYSLRKDLNGGYYPSKIEIYPYDESWHISVEIEKIRLNPKMPAKIWDRDR